MFAGLLLFYCMVTVVLHTEPNAEKTDMMPVVRKEGDSTPPEETILSIIKEVNESGVTVTYTLVNISCHQVDEPERSSYMKEYLKKWDKKIPE